MRRRAIFLFALALAVVFAAQFAWSVGHADAQQRGTRCPSCNPGVCPGSYCVCTQNCSSPYLACTPPAPVQIPQNGGSWVVVCPPQQVRVSLICNPTTVPVNGTSSCAAMVLPFAGVSNHNVNWSVTGGTIAPSGTAVGALSRAVFAAPAIPGTVIVTATSVADPAKSASVPITVMQNVPSSVGTIQVSSRNSVTGVALAASWAFVSYPSTDPCATGSCRNVSSQIYSNMPAAVNGNPGAIYTLQPTSGSAGTYYALPTNGASWSQTLFPAGTITFPVDWDPIAALSVAPASISLSSSTPSVAVALSNIGAPGSQAAWSATVNYASGNGWLTVLPQGGALTNPASGIFATSSITIAANPAGLPSGTYYATVVFSGISSPGSLGPLMAKVSVALTVSSGVAGPPLPSCIIMANPSQLVPPSLSNLSYGCVNVTACSLSGGQFGVAPGQTVPINGPLANQMSGTQAVFPTSTTNYVLDCQGLVAGNPSYTQRVNATVFVNGTVLFETNPL